MCKEFEPKMKITDCLEQTCCDNPNFCMCPLVFFDDINIGTVICAFFCDGVSVQGAADAIAKIKAKVEDGTETK